MSTEIKKIPEGYHTLTPHLIIKDASKAVEFYKNAFDAEVLESLALPDGRLMHASLRIGNSMLMLCDEFPEHQCGASPQTLKNAHATVHMYVEDVDAAFQKAIDAGATAIMPPQDMFWGDRYGRLVDPFGQPWSIATHKENLNQEQISERMIAECAMGKEPAKA